MPSPLVSPEVDLRDFQFLPLDVVRLRDSSLAVEATGDEFRAAVLLWCVAWHQIPAASLPDDDRALAQYAGYGRDLKAWRTVREGALRGFVRCDDGRLYHAVLADKANEAWEGKLRLRHRKECERIKKAAQRAKVEPIYPTFDEWLAHLVATGRDRWEPVPITSLGTFEGHERGQAQGHDGDVPGGVPGESHPLKGTGEGTGDRGQGNTASQGERERGAGASPPTPTAAGLACRAMREAGCFQTNPSHPDLLAALDEGVTAQALADTVREAIGAGIAKPFPWAITTARSRHRAGATTLPQRPTALPAAAPSRALQEL